ncbi:cell division protein PerM, partial [Pseudokineococcus marinus]|uniref:cell division protein PerM n=1 Tax=Pseudokineococcus marinus TaxID=351215 RepID=UPI0031D2D766
MSTPRPPRPPAAPPADDATHPRAEGEPLDEVPPAEAPEQEGAEEDELEEGLERDGVVPGAPGRTAAASPRASADLVVPAAPGGALLRSPLLIGLLAGAQAVLGSLLCVVAPVMAVWLVASRTGATWDGALRVAADGWLLAHGTALAVPGGSLALWPLGLALLPVAWCVSAGRRTAVALEATHPASRSARSGLDGALVVALAGVVASYVVLTTAVALVAGSPVVRPGPGSAALGALVVAGASAGAAMAAARLRLSAAGPRRRAVPAPRLLPALADLLRVPLRARPVAAAGGRALAWCLVGAGACLVVSLVAGAPQVLDLHRALDAGVVGGAVLVLGQLLLLPTALVWALSWTAGPGFAVGAGTSVTPGGTDLGLLPALPLLGGLPQQGTGGGWLWVVVVLPVAAGAVAAARLRLLAPLALPDDGGGDGDGSRDDAGAARGEPRELGRRAAR